DVLMHEAAAADARDQAARASSRAESDVRRATELAADLSGVLELAESEDDGGVVARFASNVRGAVRQAVRAEAESARAAAREKAQLASRAAAGARAACASALQTLLLRQSLPGAATAIHLRAAAQGYAATLRARTSYGLSWALDLEVPQTHTMSRLLRIEQVVGRLEIDAPEAVGWIRKEVRVRPQRLERLYLVELAVDASSTAMKLRTTPADDGAGFDVALSRDARRAHVVRVLPGGLAPDEPHPVDGEGFARLEALGDALDALTRDVAGHRRALLEARLDDTPLETLETPIHVVERLLADIGPAAREIARRSLVPGEYVLKRVLGDNRREELFVSKAELRAKLRALPQPFWCAFDPLDLWDDAAPRTLADPEAPAAPSVASGLAPAAAPNDASVGVAVSEAPAAAPARHARPQPPGASNRRSALGPESTGKWPALSPAFQK
ncbi:MAG TPA: hypothetical protein VE987_13075, partial [Polyangiaceae bacterium]|nr:hypothetical protein [Polyangiaceae bacterium]